MPYYLKNLLLIILLIINFSANAQNCNCGENFKFMVEKIQKNYVGYNDKIKPSNRGKFSFFTDSLQKVANNAGDYQCLPIFREWISYFNDKHLSIIYNDSHFNKDQIRKYYSNEEKTDWSKASLSGYLASNSTDQIEGIWNSYTGTYQIGIVKDKNDTKKFIGFIIKADGVRWVEQQIKLKITKKDNQYFLDYFKASDHSITQIPFNKLGDTLTMGEGMNAKWYKSSVNISQLSNKSADKDLPPSFKVLDNKTCLFEMPTYASLDYVTTVDSLIKENASILRKSDHLIIDLRNNFGGSILVYKKLIPYLYTNPILTEGGSVLATEDNIRDYYSDIPTNVSDSMKKIFTKNLNLLKNHVGEIYNLYPVDTIILAKKLSYPKTVSILINRNTSSAAELFLLEAKQSSKVKVFGTNSSGAIDYLEVVRTKMPCGFYTIGYSAAKSNRLPDNPLDNVGIKPDIEIPNNVVDWVKFIRNYKKK